MTSDLCLFTNLRSEADICILNFILVHYLMLYISIKDHSPDIENYQVGSLERFRPISHEFSNINQASKNYYRNEITISVK